MNVIWGITLNKQNGCKLLRLIGFLPFYYLLTTTYCFSAAFEEIGVGARGRGVGGAFTALADDVSAIYWNPAQLTQARQRELLTFYQDLYGLGLVNYSFVGYAQPNVGKGTVGFGWTRLGTSASVKDLDYAEHTFAFSYGRRFRLLSLGATLKTFLVNYKYKASGFGVDAGGSYGFFDDRLRLAVCWKNLNNPQIHWETLAVDNIPQSINGGLRLKIADGHSFAVGAESTPDKNTRMSYGLESWLMKRRTLALRAGVSELDGSMNTSVGVSIGYRGIRFDYALERHYTLGYSSLISLTLML